MLNNDIKDVAQQLAGVLSNNSISDKLENIVNLIDDTASKTIELIENSFPVSDYLVKECEKFEQQIYDNNKRKVKLLGSNESYVNFFISNVIHSLAKIQANLEDILLAQKNQYILAMNVNKFIDDLHNLDEKLVRLLQDQYSEEVACETNSN